MLESNISAAALPEIFFFVIKVDSKEAKLCKTLLILCNLALCLVSGSVSSFVSSLSINERFFVMAGHQVLHEWVKMSLNHTFNLHVKEPHQLASLSVFEAACRPRLHQPRTLFKLVFFFLPYTLEVRTRSFSLIMPSFHHTLADIF